MDFLTIFFNEILYKPLFNALVLLYKYLPGHDFGIAIITLTILIKLIFYPFTTKAIVSQKSLQDLQTKLQEIQKKYNDDKERMVQATMELYKKEKINPFSGCLPVLIQLPILIALYQVFRKGFLPEQTQFLYSFVSNPGPINPYLLNIIDLSKPNVYLAILSGFMQFFQTKMISDKNQKKNQLQKAKIEIGQKTEEILQKQMIYFFPFLTIAILWQLPSAIGLYWSVSSLFSIGQQYLILNKKITI